MPLDGQIENFTREPNETKPLTEADVFSVAHFRSWIADQVNAGRGSEEYCYIDTGACLIGQYLRAHNFKFFGVAGFARVYLDQGLGAFVELGDAFHRIAVGLPRTFNGALSRAEGK